MIGLAVAFFLCAAAVMAYAKNPAGPEGRHQLGGSRHQGDAKERRLPVSIIAAAFALRLLLGLTLEYFRWNQLLAPDVTAYAQGGIQIATWWSANQHLGLAPFMGDDQVRYMLVNAMIYFVFGLVPWVVLIFVAAAGAWTALIAWRIGYHFGGDAVARRAAYLAAFFPSLVLWSSLNLRDPFLVLAVMGVTWATLRLKEGWNGKALLSLVCWSLVIGAFREYVLLLMIAGVVIGAVVGERRNLGWNIAMGAALVAGLAALILSFDLGTETISKTNFDYINRMRGGFTLRAGSSFAETADTSTLSGTLRFLPIGVLYFLYAPFPWTARGTLQLLTVPEMLLWYALMWNIARGIRTAFSKHFSSAWALSAFILVLVTGYGIVSGNAGTAYRHRAQVLPLFLIFAAIGWSRNKTERRPDLDANHSMRAPELPVS